MYKSRHFLIHISNVLCPGHNFLISEYVGGDTVGCSIVLYFIPWFAINLDFYNFICDFLGIPCWQENQASHHLSDLRTNKTVLDLIAFEIENESGTADFEQGIQ